MAARKSCTHLTWAEAKAKVGGSSGGKVKKPAPKTSHDKILAAKIIQKNGQSEQDKIADRQAARRARRDEERAKVREEKRKEEREQQLLEQIVRPSDQAREKMAELARQLQFKTEISKKDAPTGLGMSELTTIAECKQIQLDEMMALEAIYMGTDTFLVSTQCQLEELQEKMEQLDWDDETALRAVAQHSPIYFSLQLTIDNPDDGGHVASLLLGVELPALYPSQEVPPTLKVEYFMLTDKNMVCSANKPLTSLGYLLQPNFDDAIQAEARAIVPDPCIYELADTWLTENLFNEYIVVENI